MVLDHVIETCHSGAVIGYSTYQFSVTFISHGDLHVRAAVIVVNRNTIRRFWDYIQSEFGILCYMSLSHLVAEFGGF